MSRSPRQRAGRHRRPARLIIAIAILTTASLAIFHHGDGQPLRDAAKAISEPFLLHNIQQTPELGLAIAPEHRCSPYNRRDYPYRQAVEAQIIAAMGGRIYGPYTGRFFATPRASDIEHIVALSEAHDSGLCAAKPALKRRFASDLLNLTLAAPAINRCGHSGKCAHDAGQWLPAMNRCWFAARIIAVKRKYALSADPREAAALTRLLSTCSTTEMIIPDPPAHPSTPTGGPH